jgi:glycosyltransferase involved in cell wall biosynthesis
MGLTEAPLDAGHPVRAISIAAPAYNEAEGIIEVVEGWLTYLSNLKELTDFEIVVCNDGSGDKTGRLLDQLASTNPHLKPVHHVTNRGAAAALATAIQQTIYPWVLLTDSDGQYGIETTKLLIEAVERSASCAAVGVRVKKHDSVFARVGSWGSGMLCNKFHSTAYRDFNCALKLVDGGLLRSINLEARGLNYSSEITSKLIECGITLVEVEVEHKPRTSGRSSAQSLRAAWHRLLFVTYIGLRQLLLKQNVIQNRLRR